MNYYSNKKIFANADTELINITSLNFNYLFMKHFV